jgi:hypothetical protein
LQYNSDHCLIAANFDAIDLIGWLPGEGLEPVEVVKYNVDEMKSYKEEISNYYNNNEEFIEVKQIAKMILNENSEKTNKIRLLNKMNNLLNDKL